MSNNKENLLTVSGLAKLEEELEYLRATKELK